MSSHQINSADRFAEVELLDADTGASVTDVDHATADLDIKYQVNNGTPVTLSPAPMSAGGAHVAGGVYHVGDGRYKVGVPDAAFLALGDVVVWIEAPGLKCIADRLRVVKYDPFAVLGEGSYTHTNNTTLEEASVSVAKSP